MNPLGELLAFTIVLPAMVVGFIALLFGLSRLLSVDGLRRMTAGPGSWRVNLWHVMVAILAAALVLNLLAATSPAPAICSTVLLSLWVLAWFIRTWRREFVILMGLRDDDLPGRHDKVVWVVVLLMLAPIGVWMFRSFRLAHWPEPKPVYHGEFGSEPAVRGRASQPA